MEAKTVTFNPLFPHVEVKLTGEDGNIFWLLCVTLKEMRRAKVSALDRDVLKDYVLASPSYGEALCRIQEYVRVI